MSKVKSKKTNLKSNTMEISLDSLELPEGISLENKTTNVKITLDKIRIGAFGRNATFYYVHLVNSLLGEKPIPLYDNTTKKLSEDFYDNYLKELSKGNYEFIFEFDLVLKNGKT